MYPEQFSLIKSLGYGLLLLAILDIVVLFTPAKFMDPQWNINLVGNFVERSPVLLISIFLILVTGFSDKKKWIETLTLKILSIFSLILGIFFFLLIPICISSTWRLDIQNEAQFNALQEQQTIEAKKIQEQVRSASDSELSRLKNNLDDQSTVNPLSSSGDIRNQLLKQLKNKESMNQQELFKSWSEQRVNLMKQSTKWLLGSAIVGCLFCFMWLKSKEIM